MPLTYDDIEKGRRREWKELMDPEERKRREEEEREQDPEYQKKKTATRRRAEAKEAAEQNRLGEWLTARRKVIIWCCLGFGAILLVAGVKWAVNAIWLSTTYDQRSELEAVAMSKNTPYAKMDTPLETWASWRNAWARTDARSIIATYSAAFLKRQSAGSDPKGYANFLQIRIRQGQMGNYLDLARGFAMPEFVVMPRSGWSEGDLAVLRSHPIKARGILGDAQPWILAMSYDAKRKKWLVEDIRADNSWDPEWTTVNAIQVSHLPRPSKKKDD